MAPSGDDEILESFGSDIGKRTNSWTRVRDWFLVEADRLLLAIFLAIAMAIGFLALNELGAIAFVNDDSMTRLAGGTIAGTFSLVTLVVSVNQLILSREFVTASKSEEQLEGVLSFRDDVADLAEIPVSPASPTLLLEMIVAAIGDRAQNLEEAVEDQQELQEDEELVEHVLAYTAGVQQSADRIDETLQHEHLGTFRALSAAIGYDDSWQLYVGRHLRARYGDRLSPAADEALDELIGGLMHFHVAREHFKTTYLQREITRFSQLTVYCGVPAILSAMTLGFLYGDIGGPTVHVDVLPFVVPLLLAVVVLPLTLLASFILRATTMTRRTASIGPMLPQKAPEEGPFELTYGEGRTEEH